VPEEGKGGKHNFRGNRQPVGFPGRRVLVLSPPLPVPPSAFSCPIGQCSRSKRSALAHAPATAGAGPVWRQGGAGASRRERRRRRSVRRSQWEGCGESRGLRFVCVVGGPCTAREKREMAVPSAGSRPALQPKGLMAADRRGR
jgi:hypothetical protein